MILAEKPITLINDESINSTTTTDPVDLSYIKNGASFNLFYENGSSLDADISVEVANIDDDNYYVTLDGLTVNVSDTSGNYGADFITAFRYARLKITVNAGSADFTVIANSHLQRDGGLLGGC